MTTDSVGSPIDKILQITGRGTRQVNARQWEAKCPAHEDGHASLSISVGDDERVLLHCHAGCSPMQIIRAMGLRMADLFPPRQREGGGSIVATYDYTDSTGDLLFQVVRFEPKDFRQRRPDGLGGWNWNMKGVPRVLYRLLDLLDETKHTQPVLIVEGEKDVDNLRRLGFLATCNPGGAGKWSKLADDSVLNGRHVVIIQDKDAAGRSHSSEVASRLMTRTLSIKIIEVPGNANKDASDWIASGGTAEQLQEIIRGAGVATTQLQTQPVVAQAEHTTTPEPSHTAATSNARGRKIILGTDEFRVIDEAIQAVATDDSIFQRGRMLVRVVADTQPRGNVHRARGTQTIQAMPQSSLREQITRHADIFKIDVLGDEVPAHPPTWMVAAVHEKGQWSGIRPLTMVSDIPVLRRDGSIVQTPGYDEQTGVLYSPTSDIPPINDQPTREDAAHAVATLEDIITDFYFETEDHKASWFAALLTPLARSAFTGPSPLFLVDANVRGAGKTMLTQIIGRIVMGGEMPVSSYSADVEELRKKVTSIALSGDRMILLDNIAGAFGNEVLDRALTSTQWTDRILGRSENCNVPLLTTWYATGNNVQIDADTVRRCLHIRLDVLAESPESRRGFRYPYLLDHVSRNRAALLTAGFTILSAFLRSGERVDVKPFGSFEGWSDIVRQAAIWVGLKDPVETSARMAQTADQTAETLSALLTAWRQYDWQGNGIRIGEMVSQLYPPDRHRWPSDTASVEMRSAIELAVAGRSGQQPTARSVGNRLKHLRRRVCGGEFIDISNPERASRDGAIWKIFEMKTGADLTVETPPATTPETLPSPPAELFPAPSAIPPRPVNPATDIYNDPPGDPEIPIGGEDGCSD